jgi:serine/threonine protein kinase
MDLRHFIQKTNRKGLDFQTVVLFTKQIFLGLEYIHSLEIIHCDLKPDNILVSFSKNRIVISDFGYANSIELIKFDKNPEKKILTVLSQELNPLSDIKDLISIFKKEFLNYNINNIKINNYTLLSTNGDYDLRNSYKTMIKSYISNNKDLENHIILFKDSLTSYMNQYIFSKF